MQALPVAQALKTGFPYFLAARMGLGWLIGWIPIHQAAWPSPYANSLFWLCSKPLPLKQHKKPTGQLYKPAHRQRLAA